MFQVSPFISDLQLMQRTYTEIVCALYPTNSPKV